MRILLTNDDGIAAPGLRALAQALSGLGEVVVIAPEREQSCTSHSLTLHKPLRMDPASIDGLDIEAYAANGTPADCVILSMHGRKFAPDVLVSGINAGANLGEEVFYSGTVGAAMEGCLHGLRSLAISVTASEDCDFRAAAQFAAGIVPAYVEADFPGAFLLNINAPNAPPEEIQGVRVTRLGRRAYANAVKERSDPRGRAYYWISGEATEADSGDGTDIAATRANMISVTPIRFDLTDHDAMAAVGRLIEGG